MAHILKTRCSDNYINCHHFGTSTMLPEYFIIFQKALLLHTNIIQIACGPFVIQAIW